MPNSVTRIGLKFQLFSNKLDVFSVIFMRRLEEIESPVSKQVNFIVGTFSFHIFTKQKYFRFIFNIVWILIWLTLLSLESIGPVQLWQNKSYFQVRRFKITWRSSGHCSIGSMNRTTARTETCSSIRYWFKLGPSKTVMLILRFTRN